VSLTGKWINLVYRVATGDWKTKLLFAPIVGLFFLGLIGCFILLSFVVDRSLHFPRISYSPWNQLVGGLVVAFGLSLMLLSVSYFVRSRGTPVPLSPPPKLVTVGPYRFVRNPMLTGIFIQLFGLGILFGSVSLLLIFTPLFILMNVWELKKVEEPELLKRLGKDYAEYRERVPMFFPWVRKKTY
jgi:protein-S-isoprenylcysteine O-methyltransferase Ste14